MPGKRFQVRAVPTLIASLFALALAIGYAPVAQGQSRCDCSEIVASCRAQITEVPTKSPGARFRVKADTEHCAVVEYSIDGMQGQTTVWDEGDEIDNVSPRKPAGKLAIRSCRVCKDRLKEREEKTNARSPGGAGSCRQYEFVQRSSDGATKPVTEEMVRSAIASGKLDLDEQLADARQRPSLTSNEKKFVAMFTCVKEHP